MGAWAHKSCSWCAGLRVRKRRTATHDRAPPRGRCEEIFINQGGSNEVPRAWPDETARRGAVGQSAAGIDVEVDVTEGGLTARASPDALS
jgi:hypothetical protein